MYSLFQNVIMKAADGSLYSLEKAFMYMITLICIHSPTYSEDIFISWPSHKHWHVNGFYVLE